ncbi:hypothetical protein F7725_003255 [Dissostichus mawsoni]|uniref:Globin domain-containing protein n=1 Tax=Dissostichus mawsoni TaxID=36200 RepID=A0A7J5YC89_DISMA|nr:hypothetical protein F7725_003255 [Dissostichus mawsoni]
MLAVLQLLADCLTIVVAAQLGNKFTGEVQAAFQKFLAVVVSSLGRHHKMVEWTDFERDTIQDIFSRIEYDVVGPAALARCLVVYPWTQRYFGGFGNLYNAAAIKGNPMVSKHGTTILHGLERAVKNMDDIKNTYTELSVLHSEKLHVDPDNFKLLADCLTIVVAAQLGNEFTGEVQAAFQKFLAVVVSSLGRQYH